MTRGRKKQIKSNEPLDPTTLHGLKAAFCEWMTFNHFSPHTLRTRGNDLAHFVRWSEERGLTKPSEINRPILEHYRKHIYQHRQKNGKPLGLKTQIHRLIAIRVFFKWMARHHHLLYNPASELEFPREQKRLPNTLSIQEVEEVINRANVGEPLGIRDRAILETFYSTGIRRGELIRLKLYDLALDQGTVMVRLGKGGRDRVVPIGDRAVAWVDKYLLDVRPLFVAEPDEGIVFLTIDGEPISNNRMSELVSQYLAPVRGDRYGSCHLFRHAMATHMLEGGADIRIIQAILGHEALTTTEIYTRVSITHLKAVHTKTHPAILTRKKDRSKADDAGSPQELLDALANEAGEDE